MVHESRENTWMPFFFELINVGMTTVVRSKYCWELNEDAKKRYEQKLKVVHCLKDPCCYLES